MKISICDICKYKENKITETQYRRGFRNHTKIDVCEEHKNYEMGNTPREFEVNYFQLQDEWYAKKERNDSRT
jgi:hypothetical protein